MPDLTLTQRLAALTGLSLLMLATRFHHFGSVNFLPDASLAVFFLAGFYMTRSAAPENNPAWFDRDGIYFTGLLILAGAIDYLAINAGGVSDWCVSSAYVFLIPTYAVMYLAGRSSFYFRRLAVPDLLKISMVLSVAVLLAFFISNASFYLFSGRYADMGVLTYASQVLPFLVPYAGYTFVYSALVFAAQMVWIKSHVSGSVKTAG